MVHEHVALIMKHLDSIAVAEVREAYLFLTHHAASLETYDCRPQDKGEVQDFRYYQGAEQPFAFIVNQKSLLWYFRAPGLRHPAANVAKLREQFAEVKDIARGEISVRISNVDEAKRMVELVFGP